jgi:spore germination cell wall hydrolase CwlJ-like protein
MGFLFDHSSDRCHKAQHLLWAWMPLRNTTAIFLRTEIRKSFKSRMMENSNFALRRVCVAGAGILMTALVSSAGIASEQTTPSTDQIAPSAQTANADELGSEKPPGGTTIIYSPLPLRPGLTDDAVARPQPAISEEAVSTDQRCLAEAIYYEARGESLQGQEAVAEVIFHRMQSGKYPRTICGVVYQGASSRHGCQFSFACNVVSLSPKIASAWRRANRLAGGILQGLIQLGDMTENAISFHAADVQPGWGDHLVRTIRIGHHVFYRSASHTMRQS